MTAIQLALATELVIRTINTRENILQMVQRSPHLSTRIMASRIGISRMQVWRTLHEEYLYPYHDQRVQRLEPGDRIFAAAEHICNHPNNIRSATQSLLMRAENCIAAGGGHF